MNVPKPMSFVQMALASFQPAEYLRAAFQPRGGLKFLGVWLALVSVAWGLLSALAFAAVAGVVREQIAALPDFRLENSVLKVDGPPVRTSQDGIELAVDTTGATKIDDLPQSAVAVFVGADRVIVRQSREPEQQLRFADLPGLVVTKAELQAVVRVMPIVIFAFNLVAWFVWMPIAVLLTFALGFLATMGSNGRVHPLLGSRMAAHALAIPMLIGISPLSFRGLWLGVVLTSALLTYLGGRATPEDPRKLFKPGDA